MNLILTPVYKSFDIVKQMQEAIDKNSVLPYVHMLIDDDSGDFIPMVQAKLPNIRRSIQIRRDILGDPSYKHKNNENNAIQLGYDYARYKYINEVPSLKFDYIFLIESDVIVLEEGWDQKQIDLINKAPDDWGTIDVQSVNEEGKVTYPCTVSPRHDEYKNEEFEWIHYPDWQCTLFNPKLFEMGFRFDEAPSHFDVMWGRKMESIGLKAYRAKSLKALHVKGGGNSRQFIV